MRIHLDLSELVREPRRSGIQRVERELIRHWPGPAELVPCWFDPVRGRLRELPRAVFDVLCRGAAGADIDAERALLQPHLSVSGKLVAERGKVLCAELFADPSRAAHYVRARQNAFWLVYDFLPWLHPEWFAAGSAVGLMPYLRALRAVPNLAFISEATRRDCAERILRRPCPGPVIGLGADGLGLPVQAFDPSRRDFVLLGTLEPRKNAASVMHAFRRLWAEGADASLTVIGLLGQDSVEECALLQGLSGEPRFRHLGHPPDEGVREALTRARTLLFPSEGEGYGLPPMEALAAGIPVVVADGLPALRGQPEAGQVRLAGVTPETITDAVRSLLDDERAARLWAEAVTMKVPTWREFAGRVARWVQA